MVPILNHSLLNKINNNIIKVITEIERFIELDIKVGPLMVVVLCNILILGSIKVLITLYSESKKNISFIIFK